MDLRMIQEWSVERLKWANYGPECPLKVSHQGGRDLAHIVVEAITKARIRAVIWAFIWANTRPGFEPH